MFILILLSDKENTALNVQKISAPAKHPKAKTNQSIKTHDTFTLTVDSWRLTEERHLPA